MGRNYKRIATFVLVLFLLVSMVPAGANAAVTVAVPTGSTVYDLNIPEYGAAYLLDKQADIESRYDSLKWCLQDHSGIGTMQFNKGFACLRLFSSESDWIALKIKAPGKGVHTMGLNYVSSINSGVCAAYILPADTQDIGSAIGYENRVGQATLTNLKDSSNNAEQVLVGTWDFGTAPAAEYILVLEANKATVYSDTRCYLWLSQIFMTPGDIMQEQGQIAFPSAVTVSSAPVKIMSPAPFYGVTTQVNGNDHLFMPLKGGTMLVFDLDENTLVDEVAIPPSIARGMAVDKDGNLWCVGESAYLFRYDPRTRIGEKMLNVGNVVAGGENGQYLHYADGYLYFGITPNGVICKYEIATGKTETFGPFHEDCNTVSAVMPYGDYIYAGITGDVDGENGFTSQIVKVNSKTGQVEGCLDLSYGSDAEVKLNEGHRQFNGVAVTGNLLLMGSNVAQDFIIAVDTRTMSFVDLNTDLGFNSGIEFDITEQVQLGDKTYVYFYLTGKGIYSLDVTGVTENTVITDNVQIQLAHEDITGWVNPKPLRCGKYSVVELDDPEMPGKNIVTYYASDGAPRMYNLQTGKTKICLDLIEPGYGAAMPARPLINGLPGSNELYMGAFNTPVCAVYNTETGEMTNFKSVADQTDSFVFYEGVLYTGNYNNASIGRIDPDGENEVLLAMKESHNQARIHTLTAGGGKVFAGTTPYTGYGGCLAWVDVQTGETFVCQNIVEDQSVDCLVYYDGLVFGTTNIAGGSGSGAPKDASAKLFVFDVATNSKVKEFDLRDYLDGFTNNISYIAGIAADPQVPGKFWGIVSQTLFSFTYDQQTQALTVTEELSFGKDSYASGRGSFPRPFCFDGNGNLYVCFDDAGGMRRINTANPADNERLPVGTLSYYALGEDGNLYFTWGDQLQMLPLNITQENWDAAAAVDEMILATGKQITAESENAVVAARAAYEALSLENKALVQYLYVLEEQEAALLDLQILSIPAQITHDEKELLQNLWDTYCAMTDRQKNCVKNYDALVSAINAEQSYEGTAAFQVGTTAYCKFENAVAAAARDKTITMIADATVAEVLLADGITLDLNGYTLQVDALSADAIPAANGYVVDSSAGNNGLLVAKKENVILRSNNPDLPLYDAAVGGYRFFDYSLSVHNSAENVDEGREKFWFKFQFHTDDTGTALDQDAYALVAAGNSGLEFGTRLAWNKNPISQAYFGKNGSTDTFSSGWATGATESRWLYVIVSGLEKMEVGTLSVTPFVTVNNVEVTADTITYYKKLTVPGYGWDDNGPGALLK